jgi:hypothetical protein
VLLQAYSHELEQHPNAQLLNSFFNYRNTQRLPSSPRQPTLQSRSLISNLQFVTAPNLEWMTVLSLFDMSMTRYEWQKLCSLKSLGCLYIHNSGPTMGSLDSIVMKHWAMAARDEGAFPRLELLLLVNQDKMTLGILEYLVEFAALRALHMTGPLLHDEFVKEALADTRWKFYDE